MLVLTLGPFLDSWTQHDPSGMFAWNLSADVEMGKRPD